MIKILLGTALTIYILERLGTHYRSLVRWGAEKQEQEANERLGVKNRREFVESIRDILENEHTTVDDLQELHDRVTNTMPPFIAQMLGIEPETHNHDEIELRACLYSMASKIEAEANEIERKLS